MDAERNRGVEDTRSVEVHPNAMLVGGVGGCLQRVEGPDDAAVPVVCVLQKESCRQREVEVVPGPYGGFDLLRGHDAGRRRDLLDLHSGDGSSAGPLI